MSNEIREYVFESHAITFERRDDGEWWANGDEAADALGYKDKRKVANLFRRHVDEFLPSETCVLTLKPQVGQAREVRLYSPRGLEHLAILGRTPTCVRFRRWVLDVIDQIRAGTFVPVAEHETLKARFADLLTSFNFVSGSLGAKVDAMESHLRILEGRIVRERVVETRVVEHERETIPAATLAEIEARLRVDLTATITAAVAAEIVSRAPAPTLPALPTSRVNPDLLGALLAETARAFPSTFGAVQLAARVPDDAALRHALAAIMSDPRKVDQPRAVGYVLRAIHGVEAGSRVLRNVGSVHNGAARWRVDPVPPTAPVGRVQPSPVSPTPV